MKTLSFRGFALALAVALAAASSPSWSQAGITEEDLTAQEPAPPAATAVVEPAPPAAEGEATATESTTGEAPAPAADPAASDDPAVLEQSAEQAYAEGDLPRAVALYRSIATKATRSTERARVLVTAAWLLYQQDAVAEAHQLAREAYYLEPSYEVPLDTYNEEFLAICLNAQRDSVQQRGADASAALREAVGEIRQGHDDRARELLARSLSLSPDQPIAVYNLAVVDLRQSRLDEALSGFDRVLALERGHPEEVTAELKTQALNNLAFIYLRREQWTDAEAALSQAIALDSRDAETWHNLAMARAKLGMTAEALEAYRQARVRSPEDPTIAEQTALTEIALGHWVDAVSTLVETTTKWPRMTSAWLHLGRAQRGLGNLEGAATSFRKVLELDPEGTQKLASNAAAYLGEIAVERGDGPGAIAAATERTRLSPGDADAWLQLGLAQYAQRDLPTAESTLRKAAELGPNRADIAHNLGTVLLALRRVPDAEAEYRRAVQIDPAFASASAALAQIEAQNAADAAAEKAGKKVKKKPQPIGAKLEPVEYKALGVKGLLVQSILAGSAAAKAGMLPEDLVMKVDGRSFPSVPSLATYLDTQSAGETVSCEVLRGGKTITLKLKLQ